VNSLTALPPGVHVVTDPAELAEFYNDERAAHIYALVDLEPPYWEASTWYRRSDAVVGVVALPSGDGIAIYAVSTKDPAGCCDLLCELAADLPAGVMIVGPAGMTDPLANVRSLRPLGVHLRYNLQDRTAIGPTPKSVVPLGPDDLDQLLTLYGSDPGAAFFLPHTLGDNTFVGVRVDGALVAAAGTHVISDRQRLAAIGSVITHPDHRGNGYGSAVTVGVVNRLADRVDVIGLNVHQDNTAARAIYDRLGFSPILDYEEVEFE